MTDRPRLMPGDVVVPPGHALVPLEPTPEAVAAWWRVKNGHHFHGEPQPQDASDYAAYRALVRAVALTADRDPPSQRGGRVETGEGGVDG